MIYARSANYSVFLTYNFLNKFRPPDRTGRPTTYTWIACWDSSHGTPVPPSHDRPTTVPQEGTHIPSLLRENTGSGKRMERGSQLKLVFLPSRFFPLQSSWGENGEKAGRALGLSPCFPKPRIFGLSFPPPPLLSLSSPSFVVTNDSSLLRSESEGLRRGFKTLKGSCFRLRIEVS